MGLWSRRPGYYSLLLWCLSAPQAPGKVHSWYLWNLQTMSHWKKLNYKHRINIKCHQSSSVYFMCSWMLFPFLNYQEQTLVMSSLPLYPCNTPKEETKFSIKLVMAKSTGISRLPQLSVPVMAGDVLPAPLSWEDIYIYIHSQEQCGSCFPKMLRITRDIGVIRTYHFYRVK